jgi:hypothetical protein
LLPTTTTTPTTRELYFATKLFEMDHGTMDHGDMATGTATGGATAATTAAASGMGSMGGHGCKISVRHELPDPNSIVS